MLWRWSHPDKPIVKSMPNTPFSPLPWGKFNITISWKPKKYSLFSNHFAFTVPCPIIKPVLVFLLLSHTVWSRRSSQPEDLCHPTWSHSSSSLC
jgi:hypothetical protein